MPVSLPPMTGPPLQLPNMSHPPPNMPPRFNMPPPMPMSQGPPGMPPQQSQQQQQQRNYVQQMRQQMMASQGIMFDGKRMRKAVHRKTVDYNSAVVKYLENRLYQRDHRDFRAIQPDCLYQEGLVPPLSFLHNPMNCVVTKFVRTSTNKFRCPIFVLTWTPEGRRLVTGASSGEFTLWNGLTFNFETILQAHDTSVRAMMWSHSDTWMVTADHSGYIKYWQSNMNNVKMFQGHKEPVRGISFCPTDVKFTTCSDDGTVRIWDFQRCHEEKILRGHGADVKCVDWHPQKSLIASGSKDNQQPIKLWDPKSGQSLATIHAHKSTVMELKWNRNGNWLLTASRDHLLKLFDIRNMKEEMQTFRGHKKEATAAAWHPIHEGLFCSGGSDGTIMFWQVGTDKEVGGMEEAHEGMVWSLAWHPMGHILASGSNDHTTKFWTRNRPGDKMRDRYNLNTLPLGMDQDMADCDYEQVTAHLPGMGLEQIPEKENKIKEVTSGSGSDNELPCIPGLDWAADEQYLKQQNEQRIPRKRVPYARPVPKNFEQAWLGQKPAGVATTEANQQKSAQKDGTVTATVISMGTQPREGVPPPNPPPAGTPVTANQQMVSAAAQQPGIKPPNQGNLPPGMPPPPQIPTAPMGMNAPLPPPPPMGGQVLQPMPQGMQPPAMMGPAGNMPPNMGALPQGSRPPMHPPMGQVSGNLLHPLNMVEHQAIQGLRGPNMQQPPPPHGQGPMMPPNQMPMVRQGPPGMPVRPGVSDPNGPPPNQQGLPPGQFMPPPEGSDNRPQSNNGDMPNQNFEMNSRDHDYRQMNHNPNDVGGGGGMPFRGSARGHRGDMNMPCGGGNGNGGQRFNTNDRPSNQWQDSPDRPPPGDNEQYESPADEYHDIDERMDRNRGFPPRGCGRGGYGPPQMGNPQQSDDFDHRGRGNDPGHDQGMDSQNSRKRHWDEGQMNAPPSHQQNQGMSDPRDNKYSRQDPGAEFAAGRNFNPDFNSGPRGGGGFRGGRGGRGGRGDRGGRGPFRGGRGGRGR